MKYNINLILIVFFMLPVICVADTRKLDYSVQGKTERVYVLKFRQNNTYQACTLKTEISERKSDPNNDEEAKQLLDVNFSYAEFKFFSENEKEQRTEETEAKDLSEMTFKFKATIDLYGNIISSDFGEKAAPLIKKSALNKKLIKRWIEPMVGCTWLCVFPRLGPVTEGRNLAGYNMRNWENLKAPDLEKQLSSSIERFSHPHVRVNFNRDSLSENIFIWSEVTEVLSSKEYGSHDNATKTNRLELHYEPSKKVITSGSIQWITSLLDEDKRYTISFEAKLKNP